jgi:hypothetical protein
VDASRGASDWEVDDNGDGGGKAEDGVSDPIFGEGGHEAIPDSKELRAGSLIEFITAARVCSILRTEEASSSCVLVQREWPHDLQH